MFMNFLGHFIFLMCKRCFKGLSMVSLLPSTDNRHVKAISQILYGQYHIWELFGSYVLGLKTKVFCRKNKQNTFSHGQGTHSAEIMLIVLAENTPNASINFLPICLSKPKSFGILEKKRSLDVRSPCLLAFKWQGWKNWFSFFYFI